MTSGGIPWMPVCSLARLVIEDRCAPQILERVIREAEPYLKLAARRIANRYPAARRDMVQEARITLWELDLGRFAQGDALVLERVLRNRMIQVYHSELSGGLTADASCEADEVTAP
jgi:hypothetical protein